MDIRFEGPVYIIDSGATCAFVEILNAAIQFGDVYELDKILSVMNTRLPDKPLTAYFYWEIDDTHLWLYQRICCRSPTLFDDRILTITYHPYRIR